MPPVGLEPTRCRVRTGCSALELRRQCRGEASCRMNAAAHVPPPGIEPEPPGLQPSAQTIYARVASQGVGTPCLSSIFGCHAPSAPCRCRFAVETVDSHVLQSAAVRAERVELPFPESESGVLPIERSPIVVGLERFELSPHGVKIRCAAVTPQTQNWV